MGSDHGGRLMRTCEVPASKAEVWRLITTPQGMNHELMPIMKMTVPRAFKGKTIDDVAAGDRIGRSWLLLAGAIPFDFTDITVAELDPGERFLEQSRLGSMRTWQHERSLVELAPKRTQVTDSIEFAPRLPIPGFVRLATSLVGKLFDHRHRRLIGYFEAPDNRTDLPTSQRAGS